MIDTQTEGRSEKPSLQTRELPQEPVQARLGDPKPRHDLHGQTDQTRKVRKLERMKCDMCRADKQKVRFS